MSALITYQPVASLVVAAALDPPVLLVTAQQGPAGPAGPKGDPGASGGGGSTAMAATDTLSWALRVKMRASADGKLLLLNDEETDFSAIQLGPATAAGLQLLKTAALLELKLGDGSDWGDFKARSTTITGGVLTASAPGLDVSQTWNNAGVTFTGMRFNATDTASASASLLMDLQVGGVSKASVTKSGTATFASSVSMGGNAIVSGGSLFLNADTILTREAASTLALVNGVNAQALRVYNTKTDAANYERGQFAWKTNVLYIGAEKLGSGLARTVALYSTGTLDFCVNDSTTAKWRMNTNGVFGPVSHGGANIGSSGGASGGSPNSIFATFTISCDNIIFAQNESRVSSSGFFGILTKFYMASPADGYVTFYNSGVTDFTMLQFGAASGSARPGIKVSGTTLKFRSVDDTKDTPITVSFVQTAPVTFATLPAAATAGAGARAFCTDLSVTPAGNYGAAAAGGGANKGPVWSDGAAWYHG